MHTLRFSIARLMGVMLVASLGLAALRSGSAMWASVMFLMTCAVLALGIVGVACSGAAQRAWWLGFAVFGWGYLILAFGSPESRWPGLPALPTIALLDGLRSMPSADGLPSRDPVFGTVNDLRFWQVGHCLWSLLAATLGGLLARAFFYAPPIRSDHPEGDRQLTDRVSRRWLRRLAVIGLAGLIPFTAAALCGFRTAPGLWAGATILLTWGTLGLAALGATFGRGRRRKRWLGATLFGMGYMLLISGQSDDSQTWPKFATNRLLNALRPWLPSVAREFPAASEGIAFANARVLKALDQQVPMHFPRETPLEDVLKSIVAATRGPDGRGIPIYVDPIGLAEAEKTMQSPVILELDGVPLRTTLDLVLRQLGLSYSVRDGLIVIDSHSDEDQPAYEDPFLVVGQCLLALLAAGLGGLVAPLVAEPRSEPTG